MVCFKNLGSLQKHIVGEIIYIGYWILSNNSYLYVLSVKIQQGQFSFTIHSNSSYYKVMRLLFHIIY